MTQFSTTYKPIDRLSQSQMPLTSTPWAIDTRPVNTTPRPRTEMRPAPTYVDDADALLYYRASATMQDAIARRHALSDCVALVRPHIAVGGPATFLLALLVVIDGKLAAIARVSHGVAHELIEAQLAGVTRYRKLTRTGFHEASCTQHIGVPPQRTTSDYLATLDIVRENHAAATLKGHLEVQTQQSRDGLRRPVERMRFVEQRLVGTEAAYDDLMGDEDAPDRSDTMKLGGVADTYEAHRARLFEQHAQRMAEGQDEDASKSEMFGALSTLKWLAADKRLTVAGGRSRLELGPDGQPREELASELGGIHRNEHASTYTVVAGQRTLRHAMAQDDEEAQRETANSDEFHAGSGIKKSHTHVHMPVDLMEQLSFEEHDRGEVAQALLEAMWNEQELPNLPQPYEHAGWFRQLTYKSRPGRTIESELRCWDSNTGLLLKKAKTPQILDWRKELVEAVWVCRRLSDGVTLTSSRMDSDPYIEERGAADAVFVSEADYEEAYVDFG